MGKITTKSDSYGATPVFITGIDHTGSAGASYFATAGDAGTPGIVLYSLYLNYTGTAGVYITLYDANGAVGSSGGSHTKPAVLNTNIKQQFFTKTSGYLIPSWPGIQFFNGIVFVASSDALQTTNADSTTVSFSFGYA